MTGGGTGLGKAIAVEFARLGAAVAIVSRDAEHRAAGVAAIEAVGARALGVACDIRQPEAIAAAFDAVDSGARARRRCSSTTRPGNFPVPAEDLSPNGWRTVVDIVLNGTFFCSREFARRHIAAGTPGAILNIGASYAWTGGPGFAHSAAAKAGVKNMTETLAVEWAPYGIRVNGLVPGLFPHQDEAAHIVDGVPDRGKNEGARQPAGRVGRPRELGWAATFLCSPFASLRHRHDARRATAPTGSAARCSSPSSRRSASSSASRRSSSSSVAAPAARTPRLRCSRPPARRTRG